MPTPPRPTRPPISGVVAALAVVFTVSACGSHSTSGPSPATSDSTHTISTSATSPTAPRSSGGTAQAGPVPDLTVTPAANSAIGAANIHAAWDTLSTWILNSGFDPNLIRTVNPTASQLAPVTSLMTTRCGAAFQADVAAKTKTAIGNIEAVTAIGVTAPDATPVDGDGLVTDRAITGAHADVTDGGILTISADSRATIHYSGTTDAATRTNASFQRTTTYTLVLQGTRWLVDNWQGTYTTSNPVPE